MSTTARLLSEEQEEFLRAIAPGKLNSEIVKLINAKFGTIFTLNQITNYKKNHKVRSGKELGWFAKNREPTNKGIKKPGTGDQNTIFKKGHRPHNILSVGTVMVKSDGYIWEKIAEPRTWRQKHVLVWEAIHGPKPKGHVILFLDQNKSNLDINNLVCVSQSVEIRINQNKFLFRDAEFSKTGILIAKVMAKIGAAKKQKK
ncbi:MAG: HNH endonuclease signature motif containing protein [Acidaminococcaceae bacterium]